MSDIIWNAYDVRKRLIDVFKAANANAEWMDISHLPLEKPVITRLDTAHEKMTIMNFRVKDGTQFDRTVAAFDIAVMDGNQTVNAHIHDHASSDIIVLEGRGIVIIGGKPQTYEAGSEFLFPNGICHGFKVTDKSVMAAILDRMIYDPRTGYLDLRHP